MNGRVLCNIIVRLVLLCALLFWVRFRNYQYVPLVVDNGHTFFMWRRHILGTITAAAAQSAIAFQLFHHISMQILIILKLITIESSNTCLLMYSASQQCTQRMHNACLSVGLFAFVIVIAEKTELNLFPIEIFTLWHTSTHKSTKSWALENARWENGFVHSIDCDAFKWQNSIGSDNTILTHRRMVYCVLVNGCHI